MAFDSHVVATMIEAEEVIVESGILVEAESVVVGEEKVELVAIFQLESWYFYATRQFTWWSIRRKSWSNSRVLICKWRWRANCSTWCISRSLTLLLNKMRRGSVIKHRP